MEYILFPDPYQDMIELVQGIKSESFPEVNDRVTSHGIPPCYKGVNTGFSITRINPIRI